MKKHLSTIVLVIAFLVGLSLLLYPTVSDYWNSFHQSRAVSEYAENVADIDDEKYQQILETARAYNEALAEKENQYLMTDDDIAHYEANLNPGGDGIMGYVEIPSINCTLPIYHGTQDSVLQIAVGHLEWTSLPVGGESTHAVLSGHRGLPSAKLFTNLDKLREGDTFVIRCLEETLTYEVDQILIVEPTQTTALKIVEGEDLCTLVTCTPYGINSHRLLVRGHRVENALEAEEIRVTADGMQIDPIIIAPLLAFPLLVLSILLVFSRSSRKKR